MTPIEKNIIVVDEQGNHYGATYPKRARGLVKHGRARFMDEHTICLACPPENETEDNEMSEHIETVTAEKYNLAYVLEQLERIAADTAYLREAVEKCAAANDGIGMALGNMVESRERTNQKLIDFYQQMYKDLKPGPSSGKDRVVDAMLNTLNDPKRSEDDKDRARNILRDYMFG